MKVYLEYEDKTVIIKANEVKELLAKLKINPVTVLVVRNNKLVPEETKLSSRDQVKILQVN